MDVEPSHFSRRLGDIVSEHSGWFRLRALSGGSRVAWSARFRSPSRIQLGRGVVIPEGCIVHGGGKYWSDYRGHVRIGQEVKLGPYCILYGAGGIDIADFVHLGPGAKIISQAGLHGTSRLTARPEFVLEPVSVGEGTWIGAGAVILGGSRVGRCVNIAPNAVVSGVVPDFSVVAGNPGRVVFRNTEF